jgi:hypothetical protein
VIAFNTQEVIIRKIILKKCFFYYEFDELLRNSLIVNSSFVSKSIRSDVDLLDSSNDTNMKLRLRSETNEDKNEDKNDEN